jgi:Flp pilus assembly protein TadD
LSGAGRRAIPLLEGTAGDDPDALNALGLAYTQAGRSADAIRTFMHLARIDPASGLAYENIASVHIAAGDLGAAEKALRQALNLDPKLTGARTSLGTVLAAAGRRVEAVEVWRQALDLDPEAYIALYDLTLALAQAGHTDEARRYGERFVQTAPAARYEKQISQVRQVLAR